MISLCMQTADFYKDQTIDKEVLFIAALYHDLGKVWDYELTDGRYTAAPHKRMIHHISRSAIEWEKIASKLKLPEAFIHTVTHCILSHHGQREWGSPVAPFSREAWILHLSDSMSARVDDCDRLDMVIIGRK